MPGYSKQRKIIYKKTLTKTTVTLCKKQETDETTHWVLLPRIERNTYN